jgi:hypothetical protein
MIGRLLRTALWLLLGALVVFGLYWLLLNTPESNALALISSAILVVLIIASAALFVNTALGLAAGAPLAASAAAAARGVHWVVVAAVPALLLWWTIVRADRWILDHASQINAWFIARYGWSDISSLFRAEVWVSRWLRWSLIPLIALALAGALLDGGVAGVAGRWRRALGFRSLAIAVLAFIVLVALPLPLITWRPQLPPTWLEPAAAAARLGAVAILWIAGAALLVLLAAPARSAAIGVRADD